MTTWDSDQISNAQAIVNVAYADGLGVQGETIGVMVAITESTLRNVNHGDAAGPSSIGLFQQMPAWGPLSVRTDPAGSAGLFFDRLKNVSGWQSIDPWAAAQRVQESEFVAGYTGEGSDGTSGWNYEQNYNMAAALVATLTPGAAPSGGGGFLSGIVGTITAGLTAAAGAAQAGVATYYSNSPDGGMGNRIASGLIFGTSNAPGADAAAAAKAASTTIAKLPGVTYISFGGRPVVSSTNRLGRVLLGGAKVTGDLAQCTISAEMAYASTQTNQFSLVLQDSRSGSLLRSGIIKLGTTIDYADQHCDIRGIDIADGKGGPLITVKGRSRVVSRLKDHKGSGNWGTMLVKSWVRDRAAEVGAEVICQDFPAPQMISRQVTATPESDWDVMQRLASTVGAICFEFDQIIVFGKPTWLASRPFHTKWEIRWTAYDTYSKNIDGLPVYSGSADSGESLNFHLVGPTATVARPGDIVNYTGACVTAFGEWFVTGVTIPYELGKPVAVVCARVKDPTPAGTSSAAIAAVTGTSSATTSIPSIGDAPGQAAAAVALTKVGGPYVWAADGPTAFDCSGLTTFCWAAQGVTIARTSAEQANLPGVPLDQLLPGDLVTYYQPTSHVAIYVGNGNVVSAADETLGIILVPTERGGPFPVGHRVPRR